MSRGQTKWWVGYLIFFSVMIESRIFKKKERKEIKGEQNKISSHHHNFLATILGKNKHPLKDTAYYPRCLSNLNVGAMLISSLYSQLIKHALLQ